MRSIHLIVVVSTFMLVFATEMTAAMNWERIAHAIELSGKQVARLQAAEATMLRSLNQIETAFHAHEITRRQVERMTQAARGSFEDSWQEIVSDEQKRRWRELHRQSDQTDRAQAKPLWRRIAAVVDLTREQVRQLEEAEAVYTHRLRRIHNAAHDGGLTREEAGDLIHDAGSELRSALVEILSDRQIARLKESQAVDHQLDGVDEAPVSLVDVDSIENTAVRNVSWGAIKSRAIGE